MLKEEIARRLLCGIYYPISAVAEIGKGGNAEAIALFDTEFGSVPPLTGRELKEIWLFTNHPEGMALLYEKDHAHIAQLRAMYPDISLRVMITNEDFICREYALFLPEKV